MRPRIEPAMVRRRHSSLQTRRGRLRFVAVQDGIRWTCLAAVFGLTIGFLLALVVTGWPR